MNEPSPAEQLRALIARGEASALEEFLGGFTADDVSHLVSRLHDDEQERLWSVLLPEQAADLVQTLPLALATDLLNDLDPATAATILDHVPSDEQTDLLTHLRDEQAEAVLAQMEPAEAADVYRLRKFPGDTAGGLMVTEYLAYPDTAEISQVLDDLRSRAGQYSNYEVQYAYVVSTEGTLIGVARLRDLLFHAGQKTLGAVARPNPAQVRVDAGLDELRDFFERWHYLAVPVVDHADRLLGVVTRAAVEEAASERVTRTFLRFSGIVLGEEFRTMPLRARVGGRLAWLGMTMLLSFVAASVVGLFQETLSEVIALAVFLPVISGMSGNAGNQAIAVSMRELSVGLVKPHEVAWVLVKETGVGLINGLVLGLVLGMAAVFWKGNPQLGFIVGGAQALSVLMAGCLGGAIPLVLKRLGFDPALASAPVLTTLTDASGFFLTLGMASLWLA